MKRIFVTALFLFSWNSIAKVKVITTTTNLKSLVDFVGGDLVEVSSIALGTQDPHFVEAKPSYTLKLRDAELLVSVGLELEIGWLPLVIRKGRNPRIIDEKKGHLILGSFIKVLEKPIGPITRADGDVHAGGNPHFMLSPKKVVTLSEVVAERLSLIDPRNKKKYFENATLFKQKLENKFKDWKARIKKGLSVVTYHKTLTYFYDDFEITNVDVLEPKPGVPPTANHILAVIKKAKKNGVKKIIVENYFDVSVARKVSKEIPGVEVFEVPVGVGGEKGVSDLLSLYDKLVEVFE